MNEKLTSVCEKRHYSICEFLISTYMESPTDNQTQINKTPEQLFFKGIRTRQKCDV